MNNRIKEVIRECGLSQKEAAAKIGITYQALNQMQNAASLSTSTLDKIASALNVPLYTLISDINNNNNNNNNNIFFALIYDNGIITTYTNKEEFIKNATK